MKKAIFLSIIILFIILVGCTNRTSSPQPEEPIEEIVSLEEQQKRYMKFYNSIIEFVHSFEKIDVSTTQLTEQNPSKTQLYEFYTNLYDTMEKGQNIPLGNLIPSGFEKENKEIMNTITLDMNKAFQYRKFGYEHILEYLETDSLEAFQEGKTWIQADANSYLSSVVVQLEGLKAELEITDELEKAINGELNKESNE